MATPVLGELRAFTADLERRRQGTMARQLETRRERVALLARTLPKPLDLINAAQQRLDYVAHRLGGGLLQNLNLHQNGFVRVSGRFSPVLLERPHQLKAEQLAQLSTRALNALSRSVATAKSHARLDELGQRMADALHRSLKQKTDRLKNLEQLRVSLDPDRPLNLGFARVNRPDGVLVKSPAGIDSGAALILTFKGDQKLDVIAGVGGTPPPQTSTAKPAPAKPKPAAPDQGSLF